MSKSREPTGDLRAEVLSGDPSRQVSALMSVLSMLAEGRDVTPHIAVVCQVLLSGTSVSPPVREAAYDFVLAAGTLSDSDWARVEGAVRADLKKGAAPMVRVKALGALPALPDHRVAATLRQEGMMDRILASLRIPSDAVQVAAMEAVAELVEGAAAPALAAENPDALLLLREACEATCELMGADSNAVAAAACSAAARLLRCGAAAEPGAGGADAARRDFGAAVAQRFSGRFGAALARFRALATMYQMPVPSLLVAYESFVYVKGEADTAGSRRLDALPGEPAPGAASRAHSVEESVALLTEMLCSVHSAVVLAAAEALFALARMGSAPASIQAALPAAVEAVLGAANAAAPQEQAVAQPEALALLLGALDSLPSVQRVLLFHRLLPAVAYVPAAADRVLDFARLWSAVLVHDWAMVRGGASSARRAQPQLPTLLAHPDVKPVVSGLPLPEDLTAAVVGSVGGAVKKHPRTEEPAFREELVGTLLHALLTHPRGAGDAGGVAAASTALAEASRLQAAAQAADWLTSAKAALVGTKACLGWDRVAGVKTTGTTAVADLWLQLLLRCLLSAGALRTKIAAPAAEAAAAAAAAGQTAPARLPPLVVIDRRVSAVEGDLQGLLLQISTNWRALHPVARSRAVWICACHLRFKSVVDSAWTSMIDASACLLSFLFLLVCVGVEPTIHLCLLFSFFLSNSSLKS
jgi:hypothetical protein